MAEDAFIEIVSGRRRGLRAALQRAGLGILSAGYRPVISTRNWYYDRLALPKWLDVPVISIGNLTVGGTGKTPMTMWVCERLLERGLKPAVLSRGYKASAAGADELLLVSRSCPQAVAIAHPDRFAAGQLAVSDYGAQAAVMDDGFQHRRLGRDLDVVLIDATRPFGYDRLLPRGLLREPVSGLRRASAVVVTRCDQVDADELAAVAARIARIAPEVPIVRSVHRPEGFADLDGDECGAPGGRIGALAGIARPDAFARTLADMKLNVGSCRWWPDHHAYTESDAARLCDWAKRERFDALVTTEKDAVKLAVLKVDWPVPVVALRVRIAMLDDGDRMLAGLIDEMLREHEEHDEPKVAEPGQ